MKRSTGIFAVLCLAGMSLAQAPFTIVRPADGSKVRERVRVLIPKNSIPRGGYVGFFVNGKFVEAILPPLKGRYYEYSLDTKGRGIADGQVNLEAVLYVDYNDEPRIVDRSSIDIVVANKANIPIPEDGLKLRYKFAPGTEYVYALMQRVGLSTISSRQARLGGRPAELPLDFEKVRMVYSVENSYGNGDALLRMQILPLRGKNYAVLTASGDTQPKVYRETDMHPVYMRLTSAGFEVFGAVPMFVPFEGMTAQVRTDLFAAFPLPTLPIKSVRPGDAWQTRFQVGDLNLDHIHQQTSVIDTLPARGEFVGVEWEMGHPCAKIRHSIAASNNAKEREKLQRTSVEEVIWFALDKGAVIKMVRTISMDTSAQGGAAPGAPGAPGAAPGARSGGRGRLGGGWNSPAEGSQDMRQIDEGDQGQGVPAGGRMGGRQQPGRPQGGQQGMQQGRLSGARAPAQPAPATRLLRYTVQQIFVLEQ